MLGDEEEKKPGRSLNPLKKPIKRRNMKTVQFTAPSYVEPSDVEYSTEEEGEDDDGYLGQEQDSAATQNNNQGSDIEQSAVVEPLKTRGQTRDVRLNGETADSTIQNGVYGQAAPAEDVRSSDDTSERSGANFHSNCFRGLWLTSADDGTAAKSRKGTVRNTDSFFKDDSVETRKINLTPSLLRDDSKGAMATSIETNDVGLPWILSGFLTNSLVSSSKRDQALTRLRRTILQKRARKTRNRRKKEACWAGCSNEKTKRARAEKRMSRKPRKLPWRSLGCRLSLRNQLSL